MTLFKTAFVKKKTKKQKTKQRLWLNLKLEFKSSFYTWPIYLYLCSRLGVKFENAEGVQHQETFGQLKNYRLHLMCTLRQVN